MKNKWVSLIEASKLAKCSPATLRRMVARKEIPHARRGSAGKGKMGAILIDRNVAKAIAQRSRHTTLAPIRTYPAA